MENFYEVMLESVCKFQGFESIESLKFHKYLNQLQESLKELRGAYQNNTVSVDYTSSNIQMAYLLAYYPHYVGMTLKILKDNHDSLSSLIERKIFNQEESLNVCFFAAGPAPESVALCQYINGNLLDNCPEILGKKLYLNTFDLDYDKWAVSRSVTRERVLPIIIDGKYDFALEPHRVNLLQPNCLEEHKDIIEDSHLFFLQNCLNELAKDKNQFLENFQYLLDHAPSDSLIIIADLCQYDVVTQLMNSIENLSREKQWLIIRSNQSGQQQLAQYPKLPGVLTNHLFTGESNLIPKKWTKFNFSVLYKPKDYSRELRLLNGYFEKINQLGFDQTNEEIREILPIFNTIASEKEIITTCWQNIINSNVIKFELIKSPDIFKKIAIILANAKQFEQAIKIAKNIDPKLNIKDKILKSIAKILVKSKQYEQALNVTYSIESTKEKANILNFIAKNIVIDFDYIFDEFDISSPFTLDELAKSLTTVKQYDQALKIANSMEDSRVSWRSSRLCSIAQDLVEDQKYEQALSITANIEDSEAKACALKAIAASLAKEKKYDQALQLANNIEDLTFANDYGFYNCKANTFRIITEELIKDKKYDQVVDIASTISKTLENSSCKAETLYFISKKLAKVAQYEKALIVANFIESFIETNGRQYEWDYKTNALEIIAKKLINAQQYDQALSIINIIASSPSQSLSLKRIAKKFAKAQQYETALIIANRINEGLINLQLNFYNDKTNYKAITLKFRLNRCFGEVKTEVKDW